MYLKLNRLWPSRNSFRERTYLLCAAIVLSGFFASQSSADLFFGANGSARIGGTTNADGSVTSGSSSATFFGGESSPSFAFNTLGSIGEIDITGFSGSQVATPLLKLRSDGPSATQASGAFIGSMTNYQYNGTGPANITYNYTLTADLTENGSTNSAFLRARAAFITNAEFFSTNVSDFAESNATIADDSYRFEKSDSGNVSELGSISFQVEAGDIFSLVTSLQTAAGHSGSIVDASSTFFGNLSSSGGTLTAVPEPGSASLFVLAGIGTLLVRRRR